MEGRSVRSRSEDPALPLTAKQLALNERAFLAMNERAVEDMTLDFLYKPHKILLLLGSISAAMYFAFTR